MSQQSSLPRGPMPPRLRIALDAIRHGRAMLLEAVERFRLAAPAESAASRSAFIAAVSRSAVPALVDAVALPA